MLTSFNCSVYLGVGIMYLTVLLIRKLFRSYREVDFIVGKDNSIIYLKLNLDILDNVLVLETCDDDVFH